MPTDSDIALIDNTSPTPRTDEDSRSESSFRRSRNPLSKRYTKGSVREGLARRKYAKWQPDRFLDITDEGSANSEGSNSRLLSVGKTRGRSRSRSARPPSTNGAGAADSAGQANVQPGASRSASTESKPQSEIDVLYENQRGWFFFGIPLYSRQSLLNFDPAGWETREYKASPVDITNAQLPDPSWEWVWKTWYVDMSYDVDEEGWQYSFSFASKFAWHGTQPWFHSFVRRRRWLRKRAKRRARNSHKRGEVEQSHMLNDEYFTIHPSMMRSRDSSAGPASGARSSFVSRRSIQQDDYIVPGDIGDILALMKHLKRTTVDREKIDVVKQFIAQGGDDLIPDIMAFFIFQHSRRQFVDYLHSAVDEIRQGQATNTERTDKEAEAEARKLDYLCKAIEAADMHIMGLEYWSDVRTLADGVDHTLLGDRDGSASKGCVGKSAQHDGAGPSGFAYDIQGIPEEAGIGADEGHLY